MGDLFAVQDLVHRLWDSGEKAILLRCRAGLPISGDSKNGMPVAINCQLSRRLQRAPAAMPLGAEFYFARCQMETWAAGWGVRAAGGKVPAQPRPAVISSHLAAHGLPLARHGEESLANGKRGLAGPGCCTD